MASYEMMEAWRFGPSASLGLSKSLETFPADTAFIETTLASTQTLDQDFVTASANADRGFHAAPRPSSRRGPPATRGAAPFQTTFSGPGPGNATYPTVTAAAGDLMEGIEDALSHAYKKKMLTPIGTGMPSNLESPFSATSMLDIKNNLLSAHYAYTGVDPLTGASGPGVVSYIQSRDKNLDKTFQDQLAAAFDSLDAIPSPLETAVADPANQDAINAAITAIQTAHDTYANQVQPLVSQPDAD